MNMKDYSVFSKILFLRRYSSQTVKQTIDFGSLINLNIICFRKLSVYF